MPHHANMPRQQDMQKVKTFASAYVAESLHKITPRQLAITLSTKYALNGKQARAIINALVCEGELIYAYEHGCSFVATLADSRGKVILSGIKAVELADIISVYGASGFKPCWQEIQKGWAGIVFDTVGQ